MKTRFHTMSRLFLTGLLLFTITCISAQDGIYDDIYQPLVYPSDTDMYNPLGVYSTHDQYVESGNTYTTNYYSDEEYSYLYASRISRFHRPIFGFGYYDPFYTNLYWYNYDPFAYGTSIYANWGWSGYYNPWCRPWGYNMWGWNSWGQGPGMGWSYQPYPYGGWGYDQGHWNGYWNTYDQNRGVYWGHRGGSNQSAGNPRMSAPASGANPIPSRRVDDSDRMNDYTPVRKPSPELQQIRTRPVIAPVQRPVQYSPRAVPRYEAPPRRPQSPQPGRIPINTNPSRHTPRQPQEPARNYTAPRQTAPHNAPPRQTAPLIQSAPSPQRGIITKQPN
jgi:hypothetical protein